VPTATPPARDLVTPAWRVIWSLVMGAIALGLLACALRVNMWYGARLAADAESQQTFVRLSIVSDIFSFVFPSFIGWAWGERRFIHAGLALGALGITFLWALVASAGFISVNVADAGAGRAKVVAQIVGLQNRIEHLRTERTGITETRAVGEIEATLKVQEASNSMKYGYTWSAAHVCRDMDRAPSPCKAAVKLQGALEAARHRDDLDRSLSHAEASLAALPAVSTVDPQTETVSRLARWLSGGRIDPDPASVGNVRLSLLVLLPQMAGVALLFGTSAWRKL
jgi:hypothetical protein